MIGKAVLQPVAASGWRQGLGNLFRKEAQQWWSGRRWVKRGLLWIFICNAILLAVGADTEMEPGAEKFETMTQVYTILSFMATGIGATLSVQDAIIGERQSGTMEWILSKPVSRPAFILAKLLAVGLSFSITAVILPALPGYWLIRTFSGTAPALVPYLATVGALMLGVFFFQALGLFLGTVYQSRAAISGTGIGLLMAGNMISQASRNLLPIMPWNIAEQGGLWVVEGAPSPYFALGLLTTAGLTLLLWALTVARFRRMEI